MIFIRLVKAGYGALKEVKKMNVREVLQALNYEAFQIDFENACHEEARKDD